MMFSPMPNDVSYLIMHSMAFLKLVYLGTSYTMLTHANDSVVLRFGFHVTAFVTLSCYCICNLFVLKTVYIMHARTNY